MDRFLELLLNTDSVAGVVVTTAVIVVVAFLLRLLVVPLVRRRYREDAYCRYWSAKVAGYAIAAVALIALIVVRNFAIGMRVCRLTGCQAEDNPLYSSGALLSVG